ncbi:carboxypeptidase-like regulatory domain-containing protein [Halalkalicoccus subterraneus]|uniref:carboxypeptidase-like regulatory domain-containing protein n=1 Tax=Halalkalicoccus subterraneus TaxID=2675002 RepID=UPI001FE7A0C7|nr:carboxypeptidase-like regulatory domain-containing protein [Halalkalicoccus subterraneus]
MSRRTYLAAGLAAVAGVGVVGSGSARAMAANDPAPTGTEIGGGEEYDRHVSPEDADVVVSTREELLSALESGSKTIYVDDDATIDLSARRITIPGDVTLASGRGRDGSSGALITADERTSRLFQVFEDGVRITGLRFRGHQVGYYDSSGDAWSHNSLAIRAYTDCEVDNCELYGWTFAAIGIGRHGSDPLVSDAHVHHCSLHDNMMTGLGYGVVVYQGHPVIEYNYFDGNRHSIAAGGEAGCSYEARYNIQGPNGLIFGFEMHSPGGDRIDIHHNTFELVENRGGRITRAVALRGTPSDGASIWNNWFFNPTDPGGDRYANGSPIAQYGDDVSGTEWNDVSLSDNHFGEDEPAPGIGHPRGGSSTQSETAQLRVYVREEGAEEHLEGATVEVQARDGTILDDYDDPLTAETVAGEEYFGAYARFDDLPVGRYDVRASHPGYEPGSYLDLELDSSGRQPPISLEPRERDVLTVTGRGETSHYEFATDLADGEIKKSTEYGATINSYDSIDGSTVTGRTTNEPDSFAFVGEVVSFEADGPVDVLLNGEAVDPDEFAPDEPGDSIDDGQVITVEGGSYADPTHYLFEVTGRVEKSDANGATVDDADEIAGRVVAGILRGEHDSYVIPSDDAITSFISLGGISVRIDGTEVPSGEVESYFE